MKKIFCVLISLILILSSVASVFAIRFYELDERTGTIIDNETGESSTTLEISANCYFDKTTKMFVYSVGSSDSAKLNSSVFNGMIVTGSVEINPASSVNIEVYRNGELIDKSELPTLTEAGAYVVRKQNMGDEILSFRIVNRITGAIDRYAVPDIFYVAEAKRDGETIAISGNDIDMSVDGQYSIRYISRKSTYTVNLDVNIDHVAPVLEIYGLDEDGIARGPISFGPTEEYSTLTVLRDGVDVTDPYAEDYRVAGTYVINYSDQAGNTNSYYIEMRVFLNFSAQLFIVIAAVIILLVIGYAIYARRKTRVR